MSVCEQLGLKVDMSSNGACNMLKRMNIINPTEQQKVDAEKTQLRNIM